MYQIRIHGRGGQGVVTAAELIAIAAFFDGYQAQAFPSFGVERTGAPIESYVRLGRQPIRTREHVYQPDVLIVQDASLIGTVNITHGCSAKTLMVVNSAKHKDEIKVNLPPKNLFIMDATKIALEEIGKNIVNTVILGAFSRATELISLPSLKRAIKQKFASKGEAIINKNLRAIECAYNQGFNK